MDIGKKKTIRTYRIHCHVWSRSSSRSRSPVGGHPLSALGRPTTVSASLRRLRRRRPMHVQRRQRRFRERSARQSNRCGTWSPFRLRRTSSACATPAADDHQLPKLRKRDNCASDSRALNPGIEYRCARDRGRKRRTLCVRSRQRLTSE